jgi:hypothetical protein
MKDLLARGKQGRPAGVLVDQSTLSALIALLFSACAVNSANSPCLSNE